MFDIGFAELLIIGVVALLVIGPERLPGAVRTASAWLNRFRRSFNEIKQEVQQELHNDAVMRDLRESGDALKRETEALQKEFNQPLTRGLITTEDRREAEIAAEAEPETPASDGDGAEPDGSAAAASTVDDATPAGTDRNKSHST